jgi:hypothetical protein
MDNLDALPSSATSPSSTGQGRKPVARRARDFLVYRTHPLRGWLKHRIWKRWTRDEPGQEAIGLHVGCGRKRLEGWINVDLQSLPEVDHVLDVTRGLPFSDVRHVYAEHFLEHLAVEDALGFLLESCRVLAPGGWIRLSTPNLDWVWCIIDRRLGGDDEAAMRLGMVANRAFYGWRHRFVWNRPLLHAALHATGFDGIRWCRYGESSIEAFRGVEQHEAYDDCDELPHVLIAEARKGRRRPEELSRFRRRLRRGFLRYLGT